ncbi:bifunctional ornithine acetyltransferase/N-acetylglutamate synthase [Staphylospora marina]|uniref:bifunctional ornithine acetyltransferase/N-acetylglutamate synthase n=1 Tax=Staphylospora marina TaxID=2490858 RepID=UPI0024058852|nr:bifunctional ornithine acetyltransferase/N-acetylglutamate synthase [Staphylospora marina]
MEQGILIGKTPFVIVNEPNVASPKGFAAGGMHCGIKRKRPDLGMIVCERPASAAAVYTTNAFQAAPIKVTQESLGAGGTLRAVVVNSGNANSCTGPRGLEDARMMRDTAAELLGVNRHEVAVASTGVIGEFLPMDRIVGGLRQLTVSKEGGRSFAKAILTTDTCIKQAEVRLTVDGVPVVVAGAAKGSGMIHPNMATMLAFITTDARISPDMLQSLLWKATDETFNMITVDGDSSTNDMTVAMASGLAGNRTLTPDHPDWEAFSAAFLHVCRELSKAIARDGEGATRLIEVQVEGASDAKRAAAVARAVAGSSLVKTAVFGRDANWGRIVCAAGYGDPTLDPEKTEVFLGDVQVVRGGIPLVFDAGAAEAELGRETVCIRLKLHSGEGKAVAWGCDLTHDYVTINASYRT